MIKLFRNFNGVFVAEGGMVLGHKGQEDCVLVEFNEVEEFNFIKLVKKFRTLSMEKIDKLSFKIIDRFFVDIKAKLGQDIVNINIDDILIETDGPITILTAVAVENQFEVSYTFCPELGRIIDFNHKKK